MNLSIIAEGGAMRGAYVLGVIDALYSYFGLKHVDSLTGSSASASTLSYYASDQFYPGYYIWTGEATNPRFLSIGNLFKGRPFLDIDYMVDEVFKKKIPLDPDKINKSKMHLVIPLTNAKTGKAEYFDSKTNEDIFEILRAAMAAPFVYGKFVKIRSKVYFDGSFSDPFPIDIPRIKDSRKIIILTKPSNNSKKTNTERVLLTMLQWKMKKGVYNALKDGYSIYNKKIDKITELEEQGDIVIRPSRKMSRFNNTNEYIMANITNGYNDTTTNKKLIHLIRDLKKSREGRAYFNKSPKPF